jgi:hypothetical protein
VKKTGLLKVIGDVRMPFNRIVVNPNDGYDLDVLAKEVVVKIHAGVTIDGFSAGDGLFAEGHLVQDNDCKLGTVEINSKTLSQIGKPANVALMMSDNKLLILAG